MEKGGLIRMKSQLLKLKGIGVVLCPSLPLNVCEFTNQPWSMEWRDKWIQQINLLCECEGS
jgi:hypothetical protein